MNLTPLILSPSAVAPDFLSRLTRLVEPPPASPASAAPAADETLTFATTLTPIQLRAALLEMGVTPSDDNLQLAEAFVNLGLPLTAGAISQAHVALARPPKSSPLAYALAKSLNLPTTPDVLRSLTTVTGGIPAKSAMPADVMDWLSLALDSGMEAEALAAQLCLMVKQRGRSTERRLTLAPENSFRDDLHDTRSLLLRLAQSAGDKQIRAGADALAAHIEGQQLINLAAQRDQTGHALPALYFALPLQFPAEQTMLELCLWNREDNDEDETDDVFEFKATLRLATSRLGRIEIELVSLVSGLLTCRLGAEHAPTVRLIQRNGEKLAAALAALGWPQSRVSSHVKSEWKPLWHGGEALTAPRARVDWKA